MSEAQETQTMEESAQVTEEKDQFSSAAPKQAEDISEKYKPAEVAKMRQRYVKNRKDEIEVLELDVKFMDLQVRHYELSKHISKINEEAKAAHAAAESEKFQQKLAL